MPAQPAPLLFCIAALCANAVIVALIQVIPARPSGETRPSTIGETARAVQPACKSAMQDIARECVEFVRCEEGDVATIDMDQFPVLQPMQDATDRLGGQAQITCDVAA